MTNQQQKEILLKEMIKAEVNGVLALRQHIHKHFILLQEQRHGELTKSECDIMQSTAELVDSYVCGLVSAMTAKAMDFNNGKQGRVH